MWVDKLKAFLDLECRECGKPLEAELFTRSQGYVHDTLVIEPCDCLEEKANQQIELLEEEIKDLKGDEQ